ncbi:MAG TPA: hypothetical protein VMX13_10820 [Sedimentisphaerales bacterium]|nr:hypothetical protein [Sedimentisphaerales bacterium]
MRPVPPNARLIILSDAQQSKSTYYCIIMHNTTDLLDIRDPLEPTLIVLHSTVEARLEKEHSATAKYKPKKTQNRFPPGQKCSK